MNRRGLWRGLAGVAALALLAVMASCALPSIGAGALLNPARFAMTRPPPAGCRDATFQGAGVTLAGWRCDPDGPPRGSLILLHGIADNRASLAGVTERFRKRGLVVVAYDSRAHGNSTGEVCTYGFYEKDDLRRVIDSVNVSPVALLGTSLGAAVALQEAADDPRVAAVVAAEVFSDLRTIARDRAPFVFSDGAIERALALAETRGAFSVDAVDVVAAARRMTRPVLLIHGASDRDTHPDHSRRVHEALAGPKELLLVPGAGHNASLARGEVWDRIEAWLEETVFGVSASSRRAPR